MRLRQSYRAPQQNVHQITAAHGRKMQTKAANQGVMSAAILGINKLRTVYENNRNEQEVQEFNRQFNILELFQFSQYPR